MQSFEANFDGLVGPTHNYAGLSYGNVASMSHKATVSNPREAAKQGLLKMKALAELGLAQGVLAPQERPDLEALRQLGFRGSDAEVLQNALAQEPETLAAVSSASSMWTANAATVSPSADSADGKVHFTPANLTAKFHRSIEHHTTGRILSATFNDPQHFVHHSALPMGHAFGDEGAANHTRFCAHYGDKGVQFFVFGRYAFNDQAAHPKKFPARQTFEASKAIARLHQIAPEQCVFGQQHPDAIDMGAFHNDVVSVGNRDLFFYHEKSFLNSDQVIGDLQKTVRKVCGKDLRLLRVAEDEVPMADAVKSYLFNSQLVSLPDGRTLLVAPRECLENEKVKAYVDRVSGAGLIDEVRHFDLRQSMHNGGGPACLRLRVVLNENQLRAFNGRTRMNDILYAELNAWVERHYRDRLTVNDLADTQFVREVRTALDELTQILGLGSIYTFQL